MENSRQIPNIKLDSLSITTAALPQKFHSLYMIFNVTICIISNN